MAASSRACVRLATAKLTKPEKPNFPVGTVGIERGRQRAPTGRVPMEEWPALPYEEWRDTRDTLHMCTQVIGKLRLALSPFEPQWAHVPPT